MFNASKYWRLIPSQIRNPLQRIILLPVRVFIFLKYFKKLPGQFLKWLISSTETSNFTYQMSDLDIKYLGSFVGVVTNTQVSRASGYLKEILNNTQLHNYLRQRVKDGDELSDIKMEVGRRMGWYAVVRAMKPKIVVETGVDKGLGSCVISAALNKNTSEGKPGYYFGTDINPKAGWLYSPPYSQVGEILYGDSIQSLKMFKKKIDVFINDSDHSSDYERREYEVIKNKLSDRAIVLGDNSHVTSALFDFALKTKRKFLFFQEHPKNHWYPGCGIGAAYK